MCAYREHFARRLFMASARARQVPFDTSGIPNRLTKSLPRLAPAWPAPAWAPPAWAPPAWAPPAWAVQHGRPKAPIQARPSQPRQVQVENPKLDVHGGAASLAIPLATAATIPTALTLVLTSDVTAARVIVPVIAPALTPAPGDHSRSASRPTSHPATAKKASIRRTI
jgi:hypothetical protein